MTFCWAEWEIPKEHKKQSPPPSVWLPSVLSVKRKESVWKGRDLDTDGGAIPSGPLPDSVPKECTILTETKHIPVLSATAFPKKVFADWSMYFVSKARNPGRN